MDALEMALLFDYYGGMLTEKQRECLDLRLNQDLSLGEISQTLGVSRQAVSDNLTRTENLLRRMEEKIGYVKRDLAVREAVRRILDAAEHLAFDADPNVRTYAQRILAAAHTIEE